jgi:hypothetical protein
VGTDEALAELWEQELTAPPLPSCAGCGLDCDRHWMPLALRRWPLTDELLCARCTSRRAAAGVTEQWDRRGVQILTHGGEMPRGTIRMVAAGAPCTWRVFDYDSHDLGEHDADYMDMLVLLLGATSELDQIDNEQEGDSPT